MANNKIAKQELAIFHALTSGPKTLQQLAESCRSTTIIVRMPVRRLFRDQLLTKRRVGRQVVFALAEEEVR